MSFKNLNLSDNVIDAVNANGYVEATQIQKEAIPVLVDGHNLFGKSGTGTGKTAAFVFPILNQFKDRNMGLYAIIVTPTRELALQINTEIRKFTQQIRGLSVNPVIGGASIGQQIQNIKKSNIIVGTPGRIQDHLNRGTLKLNNIKTVVLDEADEMLKMGFKKEIEAIWAATPDESQKIMFSATTSKDVQRIATTYVSDYKFIEVESSPEQLQKIEKITINTGGVSKDDLLVKVYEAADSKLSIIFTNTKSSTEKIADTLKDAGIKTGVINGDKNQGQRIRVLNNFKQRKIHALIATDVFARGIDVDNVDLVINYDVPQEDEYFIHRIGRTGRNGQEGTSITFMRGRGEVDQINQIQKKYKFEINSMDPTQFGLEIDEDMKRKHENSVGAGRQRGRGGRSSSSRGGFSRGNNSNGRRDFNGGGSSDRRRGGRSEGGYSGRRSRDSEGGYSGRRSRSESGEGYSSRRRESSEGFTGRRSSGGSNGYSKRNSSSAKKYGHK